MADLYPGLFDGAAGAEALVVNFIADEAIKIGGPVQIVAGATGELAPRVEPEATGVLYIAGVAVGGDANGIWVDGSTANDGNAADAAGDTVKVCIFGRCKVRVDGSTGGANSNIAIGDSLSAGIDETAQRAITDDSVFGRAMQAATGINDAILCMVNQEGDNVPVT